MCCCKMLIKGPRARPYYCCFLLNLCFDIIFIALLFLFLACAIGRHPHFDDCYVDIKIYKTSLLMYLAFRIFYSHIRAGCDHPKHNTDAQHDTERKLSRDIY